MVKCFFMTKYFSFSKPSLGAQTVDSVTFCLKMALGVYINNYF